MALQGTASNPTSRMPRDLHLRTQSAYLPRWPRALPAARFLFLSCVSWKTPPQPAAPSEKHFNSLNLRLFVLMRLCLPPTNVFTRALFLNQKMIVSLQAILPDSGPTNAIHKTRQNFLNSKECAPTSKTSPIHTCDFSVSHSLNLDI